MITAEYIKERVKMPDVLSMIGVNAENSPIRCPIHNGKNKKFYFTDDSYICFSKCAGAGGDIFNFIMAYYDTDFNTAKQIICEHFNITDDKDNSEMQKALKRAKNERIRRNEIETELKSEWLKWLTAFAWCDRILMGTPDMTNKAFVKALKNREYTWYKLKEAEDNLYLWRKTK